MNSRSVSLKFVFLGLAAFLAVASWCGYWLYASRYAQANVAAFESRLAGNGVVIECGSRSWGGFPFRIVMRCAPFTARLAPANAALRLASAEFLAQAYDLRHIILVAGAPGELRQPNGVRHQLGFGNAVASYIANGDEAVSILIEALATAGPLTVAQLNLHLKRQTPQAPQLDFVLAAQSASFAIPEYGEEKLDRLSATGALAAPGLKDWQAADSRIDIDDLELASGEVAVRGKGRIGFDSSARLQGRLGLNVTNLRQLLDRLAARGVVSTAEIEAGLALLTLLGGGGATMVDLRAEDGRLYFGPFRLGEVPPLR